MRRRSAPRQASRQEQAQETRRALLRAALRVVARHGYAKASVSRITEAGGVSQGTLYGYFESHQHLLNELLPAEGVRLLDAIGHKAGGASSYFDHERRAFLAFFAYLKGNPHFLRVLTEAEVAAPESYALHMRNIEERYVRVLRRASAHGEIRLHTDAAFRVLAGVLAGARGHIAIGFSDRSGNRPFRPAQLPETVADTYLKFLRSGVGHAGTEAFSPPHRPRRPAPNAPSDTRSALLNAAARVIHSSGFAGATVSAITRTTGLAVGTFYTHFPSRQAMFEELLTWMRVGMLDEVRQAVRGSRSFFEAEYRGFFAFFDHLTRAPWYVGIESEAAVWAPASYIRHFFDIADRYTATMRRYQAAGELQNYAEGELATLAYIFMAARHYIAMRYVRGTTSVRLPSWVGATYLDLVRSGFAAPAAGRK